MTDYRQALALMDELIAVNQRIVADLRACLDQVDDEPDTEPTATVQEMTVGGWMRRPGSPRWFRVLAINECGTPANCWRIDFDLPSTDRDGTFVHVGSTDSFPFLTAEQFDRDCQREQEAA